MPTCISYDLYSPPNLHIQMYCWCCMTYTALMHHKIHQNPPKPNIGQSRFGYKTTKLIIINFCLKHLWWYGKLISATWSKTFHGDIDVLKSCSCVSSAVIFFLGCCIFYTACFDLLYCAAFFLSFYKFIITLSLYIWSFALCINKIYGVQYSCNYASVTVEINSTVL